MPHLTLAIDPATGPMVAVLVGVSNQRRAALIQAGQTPPGSVTLRLLVDTGASLTCIDASALQPLGLTPTGAVPIHTPSTGAQAQVRLQYDVSIFFYHSANSRLFGNTPVIASDF